MRATVPAAFQDGGDARQWWRPGEIGPAAADLTSVLEQRLEVGREDRIAVIDGILRITDQMREAELVLLGVPQLRGSRSDSHIWGFMPPRKSVGTHNAPRVGAIT